MSASSRTPRRRPPTTTASIVALAASCASVPPASYSAADVAGAVAAREPEPELVREALALADLEALDLREPTAADVADPARAAYWQACASAWNPAVRAARRAALAAIGRSSSAGAPGPVELGVVDHDLGGGDPLVESVVTFDLIGLLGIGPSAAERRLADVEALAAAARLERAVWGALFDVQRARVRLASAEARAAELATVLAQAEEDIARVRILDARGRISPAMADAARAETAALARAVSSFADAVAEGRSAVARVAGLPYEHAAVHADHGGALEAADADAERPPVGGPRLVGKHPELRAMRLELAVADARLRATAARAWPGVRIGPHLGFPEDDFQLGAVVQLALPFPSQWRGELEAAEQEREARREALEDAYLALCARGAEASERLRAAQGRARDQAGTVRDAAAGAWEATRLRFRVREADVAEWMDALERRRATALLAIDDREAAALAALDLAEAAGPGRGEELP